MIPDPAIWMRLSAVSKPKRSGPTPEGAFQKAAIAYLKACRIGEVIRVNVGQAWMGGRPDGSYRGRPVRFGERGHSDLVVRPADSLRQVFIECKRPGWKLPQPPRPGASLAVAKKWQSHLDQVHFLEARRAQGHVAIFASSLQEIHDALQAAGFKGIPDPSTYRQGRR
jgi:hypothetical protein